MPVRSAVALRSRPAPAKPSTRASNLPVLRKVTIGISGFDEITHGGIRALVALDRQSAVAGEGA